MGHVDDRHLEVFIELRPERRGRQPRRVGRLDSAGLRTPEFAEEPAVLGQRAAGHESPPDRTLQPRSFADKAAIISAAEQRPEMRQLAVGHQPLEHRELEGVESDEHQRASECHPLLRILFHRRSAI
jgi:hypothetical protein